MMAHGSQSAEIHAKRLLATIVASSDDAIISKTPNGIVTSWNGSAERIFGYSADEIVGGPISIIATKSNENEMPALLARVCAGERIDHFETTRRHKDGSTVHVSLSIWPIHDDHGAVVGASKIARDIGPAKRAEVAMEMAEDQARNLRQELLHAARLGELGILAATFAHEVNQPLTAAANYVAGCEAISNRGDADANMLSVALRQASEQIHRTSMIVKRLGDYAKPSEGLLRPEALDAIIEDTTGLAMLDAGMRGIAVFMDHECEKPMIVTDRIELQQVFLNLIRNASDAMSSQLRRELRISSMIFGEMLEIHVSDTGSGIDPLIRDRLFQPFATTKADGMGIGLSVCRKIVEAHGGRLWSEDAAGGGAVFKFTIPRALEHATRPAL